MSDRSTSHFVDEARRNLEVVAEKYDTGSRAPAIAAIISIVGGLLFMIPAITGNVIGIGTSNIIGAVLLIVGLMAGFYSLKRRKRFSKHIRKRRVRKNKKRK